MVLFPLLVTGAAVAALLVLVLWVRLPAFLSLILVSLGFGLTIGMTPTDVVESVRNGMGGTLGFVAVVVGLGAMMGALLEHSGGVDAISNTLLTRFGPERSPAALTLIGFLVSIPVFFDVALIILMPVLIGLSERTGRPLIGFAIPLLSGLAVTHAFVPPTPGPIAVAEILSADLGWVILFGALAGLPAAFVAGPVLGRALEKQKAFAEAGAPAHAAPVSVPADRQAAGFGEAMLVIFAPVALIVCATVTAAMVGEGTAGPVAQGLLFLGHPFTALMIACLLAWGLFGVRRGVPAPELREAMTRALEPAGLVVLVTGAGGAFKQVLVDSGAGRTLAEALMSGGMPVLAFAFLSAGIVRIAQGSATVAMITGAGLTAPVAELAGLSGPELGLVVVAIASGASLTSHVNDSGFWLVSRYLGLSEALTLRSWTVCTTLIGVTGFLVTCLISLFV
ncbi:gluconate:H+ symporter [Parvularcula dongshanensis]|uniref:Gnt-I system low-affinity gluconate transporter n=1 Tax=Parvularcula dongshanensis TaxID=1173995 RepID=A0A840I7K5_9PROT|nr:Gnt-I system low-affinity gluconate transporter [Parvularcula dongshanensis]